jgi:TolB-like protein/class 3 adenylate cyclase/Flp pilus assembly protein TadD
MAEERPVRVERRLSAILAADVAGYSRLMHHDEETTHAKLAALLADAVEPNIAEHGGRVVKNTGDGFLADFPSAVQAVRAAVQFQTRIKELTIGDAEDRRIALRVGVNIGDVIVEPHDIFGDGVNIAARLEGIAEPGGICISASAYDQVRGKVGVEFTDLGEQALKNIGRLVRTYAVVWDEPNPTLKPEHAGPDALSPPHLSIVVLPFANLSGDPEQGYFVDGITESLTTDLSRISGSFVIARNTAFTFKGKAVDVTQVGRELNVRYVLEGSVQRGGKRVRVNVELIDTRTGNCLWAERFDKPVADLFDMQDEIVSRLANTLRAELIAAEAGYAERRLDPDAMDLEFQGKACLYKGATPEHLTQARGFFERALELDPRNVEAMIGVANVDGTVGALSTADDATARFAAAEAAAIKALSLAPNHAAAHVILGGVQMFTKRADQGIREFEQALALDRNLANAHALIGFAEYFLGRGEETETHIQEALRLSPRDPLASRWMVWVGFAKVQLNLDTEAVVWLRRGLDGNRNYAVVHFVLAAALARLGALDQARAAVQAGLALDPNFTVRRHRAVALSDHPVYLAGRERTYEGMRLAGVPEG